MSVLKGPDIQAQGVVVRAAMGSVESAALLEAAIEKRRRTVDLNAAAERLFAEARTERLKAHAEAEALIADAHASVAKTVALVRLQFEKAGETISTLQEAKATAAEIIRNAEAQAEANREAGRAEGQQMGYAEIEGHIQVVMQIAERARVDRAQLITEAEPDVAGVAIDIARRIIGDEVQARPDVVGKFVLQALQRITAQDGVRVRLHPETIRQLGDTLRRVTASYADRGIEVVPDPAVERIGVVIETRRGTVDGRLETQLERVASSFSGLAGAPLGYTKSEGGT